MKKFKKIIAMYLATVMSVCLISSMCAYADGAKTEYPFRFNEVTNVPHMRHMETIEIGENQNAITLEFKEVSNPCNNFYISLYNVTNEDEGYIVKCMGPIKMDKFTFTGLKAGIKYKVSLSAAINIEAVDGTIYAH